MERQEMLRGIPKVDELMQQEVISDLREDLPTAAVRSAVRAELDQLRQAILAGEVHELPGADALCAAICRRAREDALPSLRPVINGTGVVLHTNLGRAPLSRRAAEAVGSMVTTLGFIRSLISIKSASFPNVVSVRSLYPAGGKTYQRGRPRHLN